MNELFQHENNGAGAIVATVRDCLANPGATFELVVATHPLHGKSIFDVMRLGVAYIDGYPALRYCGEGGRAGGASSHSVISSGCPEATDVAELVAVTALSLGKSAERHKALGNQDAAGTFQGRGWVFRAEAYAAHSDQKVGAA